MGIELYDHIIVTPGGYTSLRERGLINGTPQRRFRPDRSAVQSSPGCSPDHEP
jgi:hypothetical protein